MVTDKSQPDKLQLQCESDSVQGDIVSQAALDTDSQVLSFKEAMNFSLRDSIKIFCISVIALVVLCVVSYMNPLEWFHVISAEQLIAMAQKYSQGSLIEYFKTLSWQQAQIETADMEALWRAAGWNGVWAFVFMLPNTIIGYFAFLFPLIFILYRILRRELNEMIQQLEKLPVERDKSSTPHNGRGGRK
ncbi:hypothetical protein [Bartonella gliris]|uniref:hypothetical protein n=1 Tax=Bartonella gliris TaxID=3004109 RepID=UPI00295F5179|nr:hypothetical protein [Bartonella gliris]